MPTARRPVSTFGSQPCEFKQSNYPLLRPIFNYVQADTSASSPFTCGEQAYSAAVDKLFFRQLDGLCSDYRSPAAVPLRGSEAGEELQSISCDS